MTQTRFTDNQQKHPSNGKGQCIYLTISQGGSGGGIPREGAGKGAAAAAASIARDRHCDWGRHRLCQPGAVCRAPPPFTASTGNPCCLERIDGTVRPSSVLCWGRLLSPAAIRSIDEMAPGPISTEETESCDTRHANRTEMARCDRDGTLRSRWHHHPDRTDRIVRRLSGKLGNLCG